MRRRRATARTRGGRDGWQRRGRTCGTRTHAGALRLRRAGPGVPRRGLPLRAGDLPADADAAALRGGPPTAHRDGVPGRRRALGRLAWGWDRAALALGLLADRGSLHLLRVADPGDGARTGGHPHGGGAGVVQRSTRAGSGARAGHRYLDAAAVPALWRVGAGPHGGERVGEALCAERWAA